MANETATEQKIRERPVWLPDTKGFLAIAAVVLFASTIYILMFKTGPADTTIFAVLTTLLGVLTAVIKDVYGYFFGSSASSSEKDSTISKMLPPPAADAAKAAPVIAWWSLLTDTERAAIQAAAPNNPQIAAFVTAAQAGKATKGDLDYLVARGMLTQPRADAIGAS